VKGPLELKENDKDRKRMLTEAAVRDKEGLNVDAVSGTPYSYCVTEVGYLSVSWIIKSP
jgi:hypothetical protein